MQQSALGIQGKLPLKPYHSVLHMFLLISYSDKESARIECKVSPASKNYSETFVESAELVRNNLMDSLNQVEHYNVSGT